MIPVLSSKQSRDLDQHFIQSCKVPSVLLMENAGRGASAIISRMTSGKRIVVVAGAGNNGGDGFVVARHLASGDEERTVTVLFVGDDARITPDARVMKDAFVGTGGDVQTWKGTKDALRGADLVVDALFGTGLSRALDGAAADAVTAMNECGAPIVALDIPSGLDADTGKIHGVAVRAKATVTFGHQKMGLLTTSGAAHAGQVEVVGIGVTGELPKDVVPVASIVEAADVARWIPERAVDANKYAVGHVGLVAGSVGKLGASWMASEGALRAGAGAVTIVTWKDAVLGLQARVVEQMTAMLDDHSDQAIDESADKAFARKKALLVGPGFGTDAKARRVLERAIASDALLVLDADALTMLAGQLSLLQSRKAATILTPHAGELGRLLATSPDEVEGDRLAAVKRAAEQSGAIVVLKGPRTLIADRSRVVVNVRGTPALATAGSGDTLAGITTAFVCTMPPFEAAVAAVYVHGAAAESWAKEHGTRGLVATDIAARVPDTVRDLRLLREATPAATR